MEVASSPVASKWTRPRVGRLPRLCRGSSAALGVRATTSRWHGVAELCRVLCRGTVGRAGTQSAGASAGAGVSGTGRAADLDPGWTTKWTRPPLHFSGFVVLGMDFCSFFFLILYMFNINLLTLIYKCMMREKVIRKFIHSGHPCLVFSTTRDNRGR